MLQSRRHRYRAFVLSEFFTIRRIGILLILVAAVFAVWAAFSLLPDRIAGERMAMVLTVEGRNEVYVDVQGGGSMQRAETGLKLYEGDRIKTVGEGTYARITFFDGTEFVLDGNSVFLVGDAVRGEEASLLEGMLEEGSLWMSCADGAEVQRIVQGHLANYALPPGTRAQLSISLLPEEELHVFDVTGPGIAVQLDAIAGGKGNVIVGEGQQSILSEAAVERVRSGMDDIYALRSALGTPVLPPTALLGSPPSEENLEGVVSLPSGDVTTDVAIDGTIRIESPEENALLGGTTVVVKGSAGARAVTVTVNGYPASLGEDGRFEKEIALPDEEVFTIDIRSEDAEGLVTDARTLSLRRDIRPPSPPVILSPGGSGSSVSVNDDSFEIVGSSSSDTVGIIVNGYRLQKYEPGGEWRYLVDPKIDNVQRGENTYTVIAIDRSGNQSAPVSIQIIWKAQPLITPSVGSGETAPVVDSQPYLQPGSLTVTSPTTGDPFVTDADAIAFEGTTSPQTASLSVNGFTLTLYLPGTEAWRYVAQDSYNNYAMGRNVYTIVARDAEGRILDVLRYVIERR